MIPVICHGCGQRGKVASIPDDIACVACRSTDIDLDDRTASVGLDPSEPMGLLPTGVPEQDADVALLTQDPNPRKVVVPEGSAPYTQRALAAADQRRPEEIALQRELEQKPPSLITGEEAIDLRRLREQQAGGSEIANPYSGKNPYRAAKNGDMVTVTYTDEVGIHTIAGRAQVRPSGLMRVAGSVIAPHQIVRIANQDGSAAATGETFTRGEDKCGVLMVDDSTCTRAQGHEGPHASGTIQNSASKTAGETAAPYHVRQRGGKWVVVNDHDDVKGTHDTEEEARQQQKALYANVPGAREQAEKKSSLNDKVEQIATAVLASNPGMERKQARKIALKTVGRYPKVAG